MTLKEIKEQIAIEKGYESFNDFIRQSANRSRKIKVAREVESFMDEVADRIEQNSHKHGVSGKRPILNCPFCGADCEVESKTFGDSITNYFRVACKSEHNHSLDSWQDTIQMAINDWNLRQAASATAKGEERKD